VRESSTHPLDRYVWGLEYVDAPIIRYRDGNVNGELDDEGDSSLYYLHDANFNVTGLVDRAETAVVERYMYEPYGRATVLNGAADADESVNDWSADADDASDWSNEVLYAGYRRDAESALYHVRNRSYHPTLGRWITRDPVGYASANNLVSYAGNPLSFVDAYGLMIIPSCCTPWYADSFEVYTLPGYDECMARAERLKSEGLGKNRELYDALLREILAEHAQCVNLCMRLPPILKQGCIYTCDVVAGTAKALALADWAVNDAAVLAVYSVYKAYCEQRYTGYRRCRQGVILHGPGPV
jgi:RHS repeat-associated protein